jgi:hypothetical protein
MRRALGAFTAVALLLAIVVLSEINLRSIERTDPLGRRLLYLPSHEMLDLVSLGNEGLMADLLFLWSIQYYSSYRPDETFLYLETVYDLITDLDPLYFDAYRVGALIMMLDLHANPKVQKKAIERLFDKGLANMPDNWELAEVAAWDAHLQLRDPELALKYARIGAERPGAPHRLKRVYGRWSEQEDKWTISDSINYWEEVLAEATRWPEVVLSKNHLYDAYAKRDATVLDPMLADYRARFGRCADGWQQLIDLGWLNAVPLDYVGNPYRIDGDRCATQPHKRIRWDR